MDCDESSYTCICLHLIGVDIWQQEEDRFKVIQKDKRLDSSLSEDGLRVNSRRWGSVHKLVGLRLQVHDWLTAVPTVC